MPPPCAPSRVFHPYPAGPVLFLPLRPLRPGAPGAEAAEPPAQETLDLLKLELPDLRLAREVHLPSFYTVAALDGETAPHIMGTILKLLGAGAGKEAGAGAGEGVGADAGADAGAGARVAGREAPGCVMCIGHNKGWEEAASLFCGQAVELQSASAALLSQPPGEDSWEGAFGGGGTWRLDGIVTG